MDRRSEIRIKAEEVLASLLQIREDKSMPESLWNKCMVAISWEWFAEEELSAGTDILRRVNPKYFQGEMSADMAQDPEFAHVVRPIAAKFVDRKIVSLEQALRPTQAPAKA